MEVYSSKIKKFLIILEYNFFTFLSWYFSYISGWNFLSSKNNPKIRIIVFTFSIDWINQYYWYVETTSSKRSYAEVLSIILYYFFPYSSSYWFWSSGRFFVFFGRLLFMAILPLFFLFFRKKTLISFASFFAVLLYFLDYIWLINF